MRFEWDVDKYEKTLRERRLPFELVEIMLGGPVLDTVDARFPYWEERIQALGRVRSLCLVCVYTDRINGDEVIRRVISLRLANRKERKRYHEWISDTQKAVQPG